MNKKVLLVILDGWGLSNQIQYSAIAHAHTPFMHKLFQQYPHTHLAASGMAVGLPAGQMGNSEVGHMHIGAGRVIPQALVQINQAIASGELAQNKTLLKAFMYAKQQDKNIHLMGLVSDGGVHAHIDHLKALCALAKDYDLKKVLIHAFTDGRDADPYSGAHFLSDLVAYTEQTTGQLASIIGRYYAMDRDQRWERTKLAYDALVQGKGLLTSDWKQAVKQSYEQGISDEFIKPIIINRQNDQALTTIQANDVVICFNFRTDRSRQLTQLLTQTSHPIAGIAPLPLTYLTMTVYDDTFQKVSSIFDKLVMNNSLGAVLSQHNKTQLRIAETEKYPHVTYFFSGGKEQPFVGEQRILCPSPKVATYDQQPEMAAWEITAQATKALYSQFYDFICLNFANPDMVGHTGHWEATVKACEVVDACLAKVVDAALANNYLSLIVADHGNAEQMLTQSGTIYTAHTTNPVPCIWVDKQHQIRLRPGKLIDLAPTILQYMNLPIPDEMTGKTLFV